MEIQLRTHEIALPNNAGDKLRQRIAGMLWRFTDSIRRLNVTLKDINGPRGGRDKVCIMRAELRNGEELIVSNKDTLLSQSISRCTRRMKVSISRRTKRRLARNRRPVRV